MATPTARWTPVDSRQVLPAVDQSLRTRLEEANEELARLLLQFGPKVHMMREAMAGQPQAASYGEADDPVMWCPKHKHTTKQCLELTGVPCPGEPRTGPSDPTGAAATVVDRAARDHQDFSRRLELAVRSINEACDIAVRYPTDMMERATPDLGPGEMWCRSCWKDDKYCEPITTQSSGKPYYVGLCRWCGLHRAILDHLGDPPTWMVAMHHRGDRVTAVDIERALGELRKLAEISAAHTKAKKRKRR